MTSKRTDGPPDPIREPKSPTYIVIAYRFGWLNGEWYIVWGGLDRDTAVAYARAEQADRAGKYGVTVWRIDGLEQTEEVHFPSSWGEKHAERCPEIACRQWVGFRVMEMVDAGKDVPDEIKELVSREREVQQSIREARQ